MTYLKLTNHSLESYSTHHEIIEGYPGIPARVPMSQYVEDVIVQVITSGRERLAKLKW